MKTTFFKLTVVVLCIITVSLSSCMTNHHTIGDGPQTGIVIEARQWYILWGLVPLGTTDTKDMVGNAPNYAIDTYYGVIDYLINCFLGPFSIQSRTIQVIK
ncbi:MAG: Bor/Iss family lipoprotein [Treponema sp.]